MTKESPMGLQTTPLEEFSALDYILQSVLVLPHPHSNVVRAVVTLKFKSPIFQSVPLMEWLLK